MISMIKKVHGIKRAFQQERFTRGFYLQFVRNWPEMFHTGEVVLMEERSQMTRPLEIHISGMVSHLSTFQGIG